MVGLALAMSRDERDVLLASMALSTAASERLAVEAAALRAEAEARGELTAAVLESVDVGIVVADERGRLTMFNRTAQRWHGLDADTGLDPTQHAGRYDLYAADGRTPLSPRRCRCTACCARGPSRTPRSSSPGRATGDHGGVLGTADDATGRQRARRRRRHGRRQRRPRPAPRPRGGPRPGRRAGRPAAGRVRRLARRERRPPWRARSCGPTRPPRRCSDAAPADLVGKHWAVHVHPDDRSVADLGRDVAGDLPSCTATAASSTPTSPRPSSGRRRPGLAPDDAGAGRQRPRRAEEGVRRQRDVSTRLLQALSDLGEGVLVEHDDQVTYANDALAGSPDGAPRACSPCPPRCCSSRGRAGRLGRTAHLRPGQVRAALPSVTALRTPAGRPSPSR